MGKFGEDLRMERLSRGIALEDITAVTKISQQNLLALEQEQFRQLPGGILSKGIVRGYTGALGLDQQDWTERFLKACTASGNVIEDSNGWTAFASNVGKSRMIRREAMELRLRWAGAIALAVCAVTAAFFSVRILGVHAGWWAHVLPLHQASVIHNVTSATHSFEAQWFSRLQSSFDS